MSDLSIGDLARRTGVGEDTLRAWERRHGFPLAGRDAAGRRRYREAQVEAVRAVAAARREGLGMAAAVARVAAQEPWPSVHGALRRAGVPAAPVGRRALRAISRAVEDEVASRGGPLVLVGCFQRERFYRREEPRWRELARTATVSLVLADFAAPRPGAVPAELPLAPDDPVAREWAVVAVAPGLAVALAGWEPPRVVPAADRPFEVAWAADAHAVGAALDAALARQPAAPGLPPLPEADPAAVAGLARRMIAYLAGTP